MPWRMVGARRWTWLAAVLYLIVAVWTLRALLPHPASSYALHAGARSGSVGDSDQSYMAWATSRNARTLLTHPTRLLEFEQCFPAAHAAAFNHPLFGDGILAIPFVLAGASPVLTLNALSLLMLWSCAFSMFLLARYWTGSDAAAFVAGLAYAFQPIRLIGAHWPGIFGSQWVPLVLLLMHRLFAGGRWWDAIGLTAVLAMQVLGSLYQTIPLVVMAVPYAAWLAVRHRDRLGVLLPKLVVVAAGTVACATVQVAAAVTVRNAWGAPDQRAWLSPLPRAYLPGRLSNPGTVVLALAAIGILDRIWRRRGRAGDDPRLPYLLMYVLGLSTVTRSFIVPGLGLVVPSLIDVLGRVLPALGTVRGISGGGVSIIVCSSLLAAYGIVTVLDAAGKTRRGVLAALLAGAVLAETFVPTLARRSFGRDIELAAYPLDPPPPEVVRLYRDALEGPVVDIPVCYQRGFGCRAHALLSAAFHHRPVAWCIGSFDSGLTPDTESLARQLPSAEAVDALYALGFRNVVLHAEGRPAIAAHAADLMRADGRLALVGAMADHFVYRLSSPVPVTNDVAVLEPPSGEEAAQPGTPPQTPVAFRFRNGSAATYRQADPIEPTTLLARWTAASGAIVAEEQVRALLPIALAAGAEQVRSVLLRTPAKADNYRVTIGRADDPTHVLATARVVVGGVRTP